MICINCGAHIEEGTLFCESCGTFQKFPKSVSRTSPVYKTMLTPAPVQEHKTELKPEPEPMPKWAYDVELEPEPEPMSTGVYDVELEPEQKPMPTWEYNAEPKPEQEPQYEQKIRVARKRTPTQEPVPSTELSDIQPHHSKTNIVLKIILCILAVVIIGEAVYYYLVHMGGLDKTRATAADMAGESTTAQPVLPPSSASAEVNASGSSAVSSTPSIAETTPLPAENMPAQDVVPIYQFEEWGDKIWEKRSGFNPNGTIFIELPEAQELLEYDGGIARGKTDGKWGFIQNPNEGWTKVGYDKIMPFSEDMAAVFADNKWGYVNRSLDIQYEIPLEWDSAGDFNNGYAVVSLGNSYGLIDKSGKIVIQPQYKKMRNYAYGLIPTCVDDKWGYIDLSGEIIIPFIYDDAGTFASGRGVVVKDNKAFYIDTKGNKVTEEFDDAWGFNENHTAKVKVGNKYGLITTDGSFLVSPQWDNVWNLQEGVATIQQGNKFGYISQLDDKVTIPPIYSDVWSSSFGLIPVRAEGGKWGYVDREGNVIIKPQYDQAYNFAEGVARVGKEGRYALIDIRGREITSYDYRQMGYVRSGYCPVINMAGRWGYLRITY